MIFCRVVRAVLVFCAIVVVSFFFTVVSGCTSVPPPASTSGVLAVAITTLGDVRKMNRSALDNGSITLSVFSANRAKEDQAESILLGAYKTLEAGGTPNQTSIDAASAILKGIRDALTKGQ